MAYLLQLHRRKCGSCSKEAKYALRNRFNEDMDWYCARHSGAALKKLEEAERE